MTERPGDVLTEIVAGEMQTGIVMPDGSIRPAPPWLFNPQETWTDEERKACEMLQLEFRCMHDQIAKGARKP